MTGQLTARLGAAVLAGLCLAWPAGAEQVVDRAEWDAGWTAGAVFERYDVNRDDMLTPQEFSDLVRPVESSEDGFLEVREEARERFRDRFGERPFERWDRDGDGRMDRREFGDGVFGGYDRDGSGTLDPQEYGRYRDDARPGGFWSDR